MSDAKKPELKPKEKVETKPPEKVNNFKDLINLQQDPVIRIINGGEFGKDPMIFLGGNDKKVYIPLSVFLEVYNNPKKFVVRKEPLNAEEYTKKINDKIAKNTEFIENSKNPDKVKVYSPSAKDEKLMKEGQVAESIVYFKGTFDSFVGKGFDVISSPSKAEHIYRFKINPTLVENIFDIISYMIDTKARYDEISNSYSSNIEAKSFEDDEGMYDDESEFDF